MNTLDKQYQDLLRDILDNGNTRADRTGTGTMSVFGRQVRHKMSEGFPILTTKKVFWRGVVEELLWFLRGETNIRPLVLKGVNIWVGDAYKRYKTRIEQQRDKQHQEVAKMRASGKLVKVAKIELLSEQEFIERIKSDEAFAYEWGELGPVYGKQWREWAGFELEWETPFQVDQITNLVNDLRTNPDSRRLMVTAWNPAEIAKVVLPPCHYGFQCYTRILSVEERIEWAKQNLQNFDVLDEFGVGPTSTPEEEEKGINDILTSRWQAPERGLSLMWNQRSVDTPIGLGFNITSYGLLLSLLAKQVNMIPDELIGNLGDTHIYLNQIDGVNEQLTREPFPLPTVKISNRKVDDISDYTFDDFELIGYQSHAAIKMPLSN